MLSTPQFMRATGLTFRQVHQWTALDVLVPDEKAHGSGTQHWWSEGEVIVGLVLDRLRSLGAPVRVLASVAHRLRAFDGSEWSGLLRVTLDGEIMRPPFTPAVCWSIDLDAIALELRPLVSN